jgi:hypothetical protein
MPKESWDDIFKRAQDLIDRCPRLLRWLNNMKPGHDYASETRLPCPYTLKPESKTLVAWIRAQKKAADAGTLSEDQTSKIRELIRYNRLDYVPPETRYQPVQTEPRKRRANFGD